MIPPVETPKTIVLKGDFEHYEEGRAAAEVLPGHLIDFNSSGTLIPHAGDGVPGEATFAIEPALDGGTIDTPYAIGDLVRYVAAEKGEEIYAWIDAGENVNKSHFLCSAGNGALRVSVAGTDHPLCRVVEAVDNSAGLEPARVKIRVI